MDQLPGMLLKLKFYLCLYDAKADIVKIQDHNTITIPYTTVQSCTKKKIKFLFMMEGHFKPSLTHTHNFKAHWLGTLHPNTVMLQGN